MHPTNKSLSVPCQSRAIIHISPTRWLLLLAKLATVTGDLPATFREPSEFTYRNSVTSVSYSSCVMYVAMSWCVHFLPPPPPLPSLHCTQTLWVQCVYVCILPPPSLISSSVLVVFYGPCWMQAMSQCLCRY